MFDLTMVLSRLQQDHRTRRRTEGREQQHEIAGDCGTRGRNLIAYLFITLR